MTLLNWFPGKSGTSVHTAGKTGQNHDSSGLTRDDRTRPLAGGREKTSAPAPLKSAAGGTEQKTHRHAKRELLYVAVREAMIRAGVLSGSFKFKVLSLDPRGDEFMVMMDLAQEFGGQTERLAEIEVMIAQSAKARYNIRVTAVYWRMNELVSVGRPKPASGSAAPHDAAAETTAALHVAVLSGAALASAELAAPAAPPAARYEPIQADEVAAFKQALAAASAQGSAPVPAEQGVTTRSGPRSYTLLTGFEDTEIPDSPASIPALSSTQYGDLN